MHPEKPSYTALLEAEGISYSTVYPYLAAGSKEITKRWALHVSVIPAQLTSLLKTLLPLLAEAGLPFSLPCNPAAHQQILDGLFGYASIGQVINICPSSEKDALALVQKLNALTIDNRGPAVPECVHAGGCVYTSYQRAPRQKKLIAHRYLPVTIIKNDVKGRVMKCLDVSGWKHLRWVLLKEGRHDMCTDGAGRDIRDRLRWQYEILNDLEGCRLAPKAFGFFEWDGDAYLAMEYIEGTTLHDVLSNIYRGRANCMLTAAEKAGLADLLMKVITMVERLHAKGFVHRDLTPHNFLVTEKGEMFFIDLELAFSIRKHGLMPPFALGSRGYMSPEQKAVKHPEKAEDIYGLGSMMIALFSGISPTRFDRADLERLTASLLFFTGEQTLTALIISCLQEKPEQRPDLAAVKVSVAMVAGTVSPAACAVITNRVTPIPNFIEKALQAICSPLFTDARQLWWSKENLPGNTTANESYRPVIDWSLYKGIAGIIYLFAMVKRSGYDTAAYSEVVEKNFAFVKEQAANPGTVQQVGLFGGVWGLGMAVAAAVQAGLLPESEENRDNIGRWLQGHGQGVSLSDGIAGQGIALFSSYPNWGEPLVKVLPPQKIKELYRHTKKVKECGLFKGRAGVALFMLAYLAKYKNETAANVAEQLLRKLYKEAKTSARKLSPWLGEGITGLAFVFIKAYETTGYQVWKLAAELLLSLLPEKIIDNAPEFAGGLTGLGETYLEAYRVFGDIVWKERADWIARFLQHTFFEQPDGSLYWQTGLSTIPSAGLMDGNAGVIHFMLRCENQDLPFPIFNIRS